MMKSIEQYEFFKEIASFAEQGQFSNWMWATLDSIYNPSTTGERNEFRNFLSESKSLYSPQEALSVIYEALEKDSQKLPFRKSIGDVLTTHGNAEGTPPEACKDLIYLISSVRAVESLYALVPTIGNGLLGQQQPDFLFVTMACLKSLAPAPEAQFVTLELVNSHNFDDGYLLEAIGILAECDLSKIPSLSIDFTPRLKNFRKTVEKLGGEEWNAYLDVANEVIGEIQRRNPVANLDTIRAAFFGSGFSQKLTPKSSQKFNL